jgi:REP element-mobilizing transposase RayT
MPNHVHLILTAPEGSTLERTMQFIKSGLPNQAGKLLEVRCAIWRKSFLDRRVRDAADCERYREYNQNPVRAGLVESADRYRFSSLNADLKWMNYLSG